MFGDRYLSPLNWDIQQNVEWYNWKVRTGVDVVNGVHRLPGTFKTLDAVRKDALDPYIAVRSSYVQYREAAVNQ
jgi:ABC-type transporter lipoprotein component MlaA